MKPHATLQPLSSGGRTVVLFAAFAGLLFDGFEMGLMPIASLSVSKSLLGAGYSPVLGGDWFASFTAALMAGAAVGGIALGALGDRIGRARAMGVSVLFYSVFAGLGAFVKTQDQMLMLRFLVGLGAGGMWPNGVALVSECWPNASRPLVAGVAGAGINAGYLVLATVTSRWPVTAESWRWLFQWAAAPALLGLACLLWLPESPKWLASRRGALGGSGGKRVGTPGTSDSKGTFLELFRSPLLRTSLVGIALGSVPLVGAWAASKWMVPWADQVGGAERPGYKAITTFWWGVGATVGSFAGAPLTAWVGRRLAYALISLGALVLTFSLFRFTEPLRTSFLPMVCLQGFVATLFFGWLPLCLPELFPTRVRAAGAGMAYNSGRFATAVGVFFAGALFASLGGSYSMIGAVTSSIYALGLVVIWFAPDTSRRSLDEE